MKSNRDKLSEVLDKRGYKNEDLINEIESVYYNNKLEVLQGLIDNLNQTHSELVFKFLKEKISIIKNGIIN